MSENPPLDVPGASRRHVVLMGAAVTVAAGGLTGCSSGSATPISAAGTGSAAAAPDGSASGAASAPAAGGDTTPAATTPAGAAGGPAAARATTAPSGKKAAATTATKPVSKASAAATPGSTPAKPTEDFAKGALAKLSSVPVGGSLKVGNVVIGLPSSARVVGHSAICTHQGYPVGAGGRTLDCPCHGSAFDAFTGAVKQGPATAPLPGISLVIKGSYVHHA